MNATYSYSCLVPFHLADPAGMLFFGHAFSLFHQAYEHFIIDKLNNTWLHWFQNSEWIIPIRHAEAQYLHPVIAGQNCVIEIKISSLSTSSFTLDTSIHQAHLCCILKTVHVFCDRQHKQKIPIPEAILTQLKTLNTLPVTYIS